VQIAAIGTADRRTGYVFGITHASGSGRTMPMLSGTQDFEMLRKLKASQVRHAGASAIHDVQPLHAACSNARAARQTLMNNEGFPDEKSAAIEMMKREIKRAVSFTRWEDRWAMHPWPIAAEPSKYVCWLTDHGDYDEDHTANLYLLATLHPIDRFFMQTRRRVSLAERSVVSSRNQRRMWSGYSAYSPAVLQRYLEICRTYYNYCLIGKDDKTSAMRLGLAKAPQTADAILRFS
jgi:hypothetical protein